MCKWVLGVALGLILLLCACEPEPTPLPVNPIVESTPAPTEETVSSLRYAIAPDLLPFLPAADRDAIAAHAETVPLDAPPNPADLGTQYEIVVISGAQPDFTPAPNPLRVDLVVDTTLSPLDDPMLADIVRSAVEIPNVALALFSNRDVVVTGEYSFDASALRRDLANLGYPDGFDLTLRAESAQIASAVAKALNAVSIRTRLATADEPAHLTVTTTQTEGAIPLFSMPISYRAAEGLTITFTPSGFPIAQR